MADSLLRFLFDQAPVRGECVSLDTTWREVLDRHDYPPVLQSLLGELMAAAALLSATLKFDGSLIMQLHGTGVLKLLVVECTADLGMRATAKWDGEIRPQPLRDLLGHGKFVITLDPETGQQPYQGIVALEGDSVAAILEGYMARSEQLETRFWLAANQDRATGLLLQKLPDGHGDPDAWDRTQMLASTLNPPEQLSISLEDMLHRLFHEEELRLLSETGTVFRCSCSRERVANMLKMLGQQEVNETLAEQGRIEVKCEFCNTAYDFDPVDARQLFVGDGSLSEPGHTRH